MLILVIVKYQMGKCYSTINHQGKPLLIDQKKSTYHQITSILKPIEIKALELIFLDLASRNSLRRINLENFLMFFHKNGFWGQLLFRQFDLDNSDLLNLDQFIIGIARIFKSDQSKKIMMLFRFFSGNQTDGIYYKDFLRLLYNYPKEDLKNILEDRSFFQTELKKNLRLLKLENRDRESSFRQLSYIRNSNIPMGLIEEEPQSSQVHFRPSNNKNQEQKNQNNDVNRIVKTAMKNNQLNTMILYQCGDKRYQVRTSNIQQLVKKFAEKIYKDYEVSIYEGKLSYENFSDWIKNHKRLYDDYFSGFHGEIWGCIFNQTGIHLAYVKERGQMRSTATTVIYSKDTKKQKSFKVHLKLINTILVVYSNQNSEKLIDIICLEGLIVCKLFNDDYGFGFEIKHRDGVYTPKYFFLDNQPLLKDWMEALKYYKGETFTQKYTLGLKLGVGKFSIVFECRNNKTLKRYAVKEIETFKLEQETKDLIAQQSLLMPLFNHPFLLKFHEAIQTRSHLYIVTQLVEGKNLYDCISKKEPLLQFEAAVIGKQIILGLRYLHSLGIVHRDMKPENILVEGIHQEGGSKVTQYKNIRIRIIDFGFATYLSNIQSLQYEKLVVGTPNYIAPELLKQQKLSFKIDNFAVGSIIYYMLSGKLPFTGYNISETFQRTIQGIFDFQDQVWTSVTLEAKDLIRKLLNKNPDERISLEDALKHKWFKTASSINQISLPSDRQNTEKKIKTFSNSKLTSAHIF